MTSAIHNHVHLLPPQNQSIKDWSPSYCLISGSLCLKLKVDILLNIFLIPLWSDWSHLLPYPTNSWVRMWETFILHLSLPQFKKFRYRVFSYSFLYWALICMPTCISPFFLLTWEHSSTSILLCLTFSVWFLQWNPCWAHEHISNFCFLSFASLHFPRQAKPSSNIHPPFFSTYPDKSGSNTKGAIHASFPFAILPLEGQFFCGYTTQLQMHTLLPTVKYMYKMPQIA